MIAQRKLKAVRPSQSTALAKSDFLQLPGCELTETGLTIAPGMKREEWERIGEALRKAESGIQWWLGDWMAYGDKEYGDKRAKAADANEQTGINVDTLITYQWVAERVPSFRRLKVLSWSHHQAVAALKPKQQVALLAKAEAEGLSYRDLKREVEKSERAKNFKLVNAILEKIWDRIQDGCYTVETIMKCPECGNNFFDLDPEEIKLYMQQLVGSGKAEWRKQGGRKEDQPGGMPDLCVPAGMVAGSDYHGYRPKVEYGDEGKEEHF